MKTSETQVGVVGAGRMGRGIAKNLLAGGYQVCVIKDRSTAFVDELVQLGATLEPSLTILCEKSDVIITCLPSIGAMISVYESKEGVIDNARAGTVVIDCSTSDPALTLRLHDAASQRNIYLVDAPLLGSRQMAWDGQIGTVVGGTTAGLELAMPIINTFSGKVLPSGGPSTGHTVKLLNNAVTLTNSAILFEAFAVANTQGIDWKLLAEVMGSSGAASQRLTAIAPKLMAGDKSVNFALGTATKDLTLYAGYVAQSSVPTGVSRATLDQFQSGLSAGLADEDVSSLAGMLIAGAKPIQKDEPQ